MAERGVVLTYETVRQWGLKFGQTYANELRRRPPKPQSVKCSMGSCSFNETRSNGNVQA